MRRGPLCKSTAKGRRASTFFSLIEFKWQRRPRPFVCEGRGRGKRKLAMFSRRGVGASGEGREGELFFALVVLALTLMMMKSLFLRATFWLFASSELESIAKTMMVPVARQVHK